MPSGKRDHQEEHREFNSNRMQEALFTIGDHVAGGVTGAATAVAVHAVVSPQLDMVIAMLVGRAIGMIVHPVLTLLLSPVLGMFHVMVTSATFCSLPDPLRGLQGLHRCLKPGGQPLMFEHVRSRIGPIAILQDLMTPISRLMGPHMNRDTVSNVLRAGFEPLGESNVYMDVAEAIESRRPP
jgi:hypothetical protein